MISHHARAFAVALLLVATTSTVVACSSTRSFGTQVDDAWITAKIKSEYASSDKVDAMDVSVKTRNGVVTLTGRVKNQKARRAAVKIAKRTDGVSSVQDELEVDKD